jgi:serine/threonine protein kinase
VSLFQHRRRRPGNFALCRRRCYHARENLRHGAARAARSGREDLMSAMRIGKFQVIGKLGTGAHSAILHVRRSADSTNYALKVVPIAGAEDRKFLEQAEHEFRVAQMLDHPNIIKVYALEILRDWFFRVNKVHLLIEYVNGKTLDTIPRLPIPKLVQVFEKVASALVHMHRRGVFHADLKPNNIVLSRTGDVKVIDFGLAWIRGEDKGRVQGTPEYIAPEQAKHRMVNERTDLYNFGATMYRMLTMRLPPSMVSKEDGGLPINAKAWKKLLKPVDELAPDAPKVLCDLVHRCLAFDAHDRPERASEVQGTLDHLAEDLVRSPEDRLEMLEW